MDIRISKESEVPLRQQLAEQIVFLIATEKLKPGEFLPSVRELARRLKIHHNTVSQAYQDLSRRNWVRIRRGSRTTVLPPQERTQDLDDLINATIQLARERGYGLRDLERRVRERLQAQSPDHLLVVAEEPGFRELLREEIRLELAWPVEACSQEELASNRGRVVGAQVVTPLIYVEQVVPLLPKNRPVIPLVYDDADKYLEQVRALQEPSLIAVVSVSERFLRTAISLLAPVVGQRHTLQKFSLPLPTPNAMAAADLVFCDSIASRQVKAAKLVHYRLISPACLEQISNAMKS